MNNDKADGHCYGFAEFNSLGHLVTPIFPSRIRFYLQLSPHCSKNEQKSMIIKSVRKRDMEISLSISNSDGSSHALKKKNNV